MKSRNRLDKVGALSRDRCTVCGMETLLTELGGLEGTNDTEEGGMIP